MNNLLRRKLSAIAILSASLLAVLPSVTSMAAVSAQEQEQVPDYYRIMLGKMEVTALYDGYVQLDTKLFQGISEPDMQALLSQRPVDNTSGIQAPQSQMPVDNTSGMQTAVNAFLVNIGTNLVLVDAGAAQCLGPSLGAVVSNLQLAGYQPEQVDTVLLTHLHPDHVCGITRQGKAVFPNATLYVAQEEGTFWLNQEKAQQVLEAVAPYQQQGRLKQYQRGETLLPGLEIVPTPGHTPGHSAYLFSLEGRRVLLWGDIVHSHAIQFEHPEVSIEFDTDQQQAITTRRQMFAKAAQEKFLVGGAHLPFPGLGHLRAENAETGFGWIPLE